jgi:hypothetical protein
MIVNASYPRIDKFYGGFNSLLRSLATLNVVAYGFRKNKPYRYFTYTSS